MGCLVALFTVPLRIIVTVASIVFLLVGFTVNSIRTILEYWLGNESKIVKKFDDFANEALEISGVFEWYY